MFVAMNRFTVKAPFADAFEQRWRDRESHLDQFEGFVRFWMLRTAPAEDLVEFVSHSQWSTEEYFLNWLESDKSKRAHAAGQDKTPSMKDMLAGPPQFKGYTVVLDQVPGHRVDARSIYLDMKVEKAFSHELPAQQKIAENSKAADLPAIAIGAFEGRLLEILLRSNGAKKGVEIGTLGGYSTSWLCRAVGPKGFVHTCEIDPHHAEVAKKNLMEAGFEGRFEVLLGNALSNLQNLEKQGPFDFVFIDADKASYPKYCQWALKNVRPGGLLICDNAYIWGGMNHFMLKDQNSVPLPEKSVHGYTRAQFAAMSETWTFLAGHPELASLVLPTGDGLAVAVRL